MVKNGIIVLSLLTYEGIMTKQTTIFLLAGLISALTGCGNESDSKQVEGTSGATKESKLHYPGETHLKNVRQITFGGDNAEAYWSFNDSLWTVQITNPKQGVECDQIYMIHWQTDDLHNKMPKLISTGYGRTTCSYFLPGDSLILYASTHLADSACPPVPEKRADGKYVWPIYPSFDIFVADTNGNIVKQLTDYEGYDAEATVSPKGDKIVFTSLRTGDLELFTMNIDGSDLKQITFDLGYDGGAFFSPDGSKIIFRASRPKTEEDIAEYKNLLKQGLVMPTQMELYICDVDGSNMRQLTNLGGANWAPFFHPSGEKIIFSSNHAYEKGFPFNLYLINIDGTGLEQVTYDGVFDAFPVFSNSGKYLVWSSNRVNGGTHETNLFVAEWVD